MQVRSLIDLEDISTFFSTFISDLNDFNSTPVTLIIPPDEQSLGVVDFPVTIGIVDDAINEATEQVFVVQLQVVNSTSQSSIDLSSRPSSLCRIIDNDGWLNGKIQ